MYLVKSSPHFFLKYVDFTLLDIQHVLQIMDFSVECALFFRHFLDLLTLFV